jgi:chromosome segregation ATPase
MSDESTPQPPQPSEMELLRAEMRAGFQSVAKRFDAVDSRFDRVDAHLAEHDQRFNSVSGHLTEHDQRFEEVGKRLEGHDQRFDELGNRLDGHDKQFVSLDSRITSEAEATRRHFDVVAEGLRESFQVVIDKTTATGKKVDRLIASNAVEHAAFLEAITDHEVRITRLEKG